MRSRCHLSPNDVTQSSLFHLAPRANWWLSRYEKAILNRRGISEQSLDQGPPSRLLPSLLVATDFRLCFLGTHGIRFQSHRKKRPKNWKKGSNASGHSRVVIHKETSQAKACGHSNKKPSS